MSYSQPPFGGGYPPQPYQQYQPPKRHGLRYGCLITAGALGGLTVILVIIAAVVSGTGKPSAAGGPPVPAASPAGARSLPGTGQVVRDGSFAFTVKRVSCGSAAARAVAAGGLGEKVPAGARECVVTLRIANDKGSSQTFSDGSQYAYDARGRQFAADGQGSVFLRGDQDGTQVNPGITITARVPFQIPAGDRIVRLVLHDSAFSGGVTVRIAG